MVRFRMFKINVNQFAILADNPSSDVRIENKLGIDFSKENRNVRIKIDFNFLDGTHPLMVLKMNCEFNIHQEDWQEFVKEDKTIIPKGIFVT